MNTALSSIYRRFQTLHVHTTDERNNFVSASGQHPWRGYTVYLRVATGGWRSFLSPELFPTGSGRRRGSSHVFHEFRENRQSERTTQNRIGGLWDTEGENAIPWSHVGTIRDWYSTVSHNW